MDTKHTPGPWELSTASGRLPAVRAIRSSYGEASRYESSVRSASGEHVCKLDFGYGRACDEANAVFIVRACNNHAAMLAALKALVAAYEDPQLDDPHALVVTAKDAIDNAEAH